MRFLFTVAVLFGLMTPNATAAQDDEWSRVLKIARGQEVRVETADRKVRGMLVSVSESELALADVSFARADITRVFVKGKSHRVRNSLIGAAVGVGIGIAMAATFGTYFNNETGEEHYGAMIAVPIGAGAALGAAMPTGGFRKIYDVRRSQERR